MPCSKAKMFQYKTADFNHVVKVTKEVTADWGGGRGVGGGVYEEEIQIDFESNLHPPLEKILKKQRLIGFNTVSAI